MYLSVFLNFEWVVIVYKSFSAPTFNYIYYMAVPCHTFCFRVVKYIVDRRLRVVGELAVRNVFPYVLAFSLYTKCLLGLCWVRLTL